MVVIILKKVRFKILYMAFLLIALIVIVVTYCVFNFVKSSYEKVNAALIDYYKIASPDWYLVIDKNQTKSSMMYTYNIKSPTSNNITNLTSSELTPFYNGYVRQKSFVDLNPQKYEYYNFPEDIMDKVDSGVVFYHPSTPQPYNELNDSKDAEKIAQNNQFEVSISFDKGYSIDEVKKLFSDEKGVVWLWVDTYNNINPSGKTSFLAGESHESVGNNHKRIINPSEAQVFGIKLVDEQNQIIQKPEDTFIDILNKYNNPKENAVAEKIYEIKQSINKDDKIKKEDLKILGLILRCDRTGLMNIKNKEFIKGIYIYNWQP